MTVAGERESNLTPLTPGDFSLDSVRRAGPRGMDGSVLCLARKERPPTLLPDPLGSSSGSKSTLSRCPPIKFSLRARRQPNVNLAGWPATSSFRKTHSRGKDRWLSQDAESRVAGFSRAAECTSKYTVVSAWVRKIEAGAIELISPSKHAFTAFALRVSGTMHTILLVFKIWRTLMEMARCGTSARAANHPSPSCWRRQASSNVTTI